ncbi:MAG: DUF3127 domain-containing protein [Rikenellaceae bacterium]|nr:DUF3127 domain-containing protein [Rikenellaceae bacterium]MCL2693316.1 DUF3127 domain-containing protein [Rikenellaceae bacterium]
MEIEGTVVQILPQVKGVSARGEWVKQEVIFEQPGEFGRKVCVSFWGDKAQDAAAMKPGERAKMSVSVESREYNGRWYTELRAWKLDKGQAGAPAPSMPYAAEAGAGAPTGGYVPMPVTEEPNAATKDEFDDLPF